MKDEVMIAEAMKQMLEANTEAFGRIPVERLAPVVSSLFGILVVLAPMEESVMARMMILSIMSEANKLAAAYNNDQPLVCLNLNPKEAT